MVTGSTLVRDEDGKEFIVIVVSHWSTIQAADGEKDTVKWYGGDSERELYVSADKGFGYTGRDQ